MKTLIIILAIVCYNVLRRAFMTSATIVDYFYQIGIGISQFGNVFFGELLNDLAYKKDGYRNVLADESISGKTGKNLLLGKLKLLGKFIVWLTNIFEHNHVENSIEKEP